MNVFLDCFPGGKRKALTMSYDDGQIHDRRLVSIFNQHGIKGTFHLNSGKFDKEPFLNSSEVKELFKGHEVSVHTVSHPYLQFCSKEGIAEEITEDRKNLEKLVGYPVRGMSYPYGTYNDTVLNVLPSLGIEYSRTTVSHGKFTLPEDFLTWPATCHHRDNLIERGKEFLAFGRKGMLGLMYVWGHSYEFDRQNNWEVIEEFCSLIGNNQDIWYATNIEIVDYVKAMRNLKFTASSDIVYNPSAISVWISVEGEPKEVPAGAVVKI